MNRCLHMLLNEHSTAHDGLIIFYLDWSIHHAPKQIELQTKQYLQHPHLPVLKNLTTSLSFAHSMRATLFNHGRGTSDAALSQFLNYAYIHLLNNNLALSNKTIRSLQQHPSLLCEQLKRRPSLPVLKNITRNYSNFIALCYRVSTCHACIPILSSLQTDLQTLEQQRFLFILALLSPATGASTASEKFAQSSIFNRKLVGDIFSFHAEGAFALLYTDEKIEYENELQPQT